MKSLHAKREIQNAAEFINRMENSKNFDEYEQNWRNFLTALEKVWNLAEREGQSVSSKFQPWQGSYKNKRRIDPLLKYLKNARDADMHSIQEIVQTQEAAMTISTGGTSGNVHIERLEISGGKITTGKTSQPLIIRFIPSNLIVLPVINNGQAVPTPDYHIGQRVLDNTNPIKLAKVGLKYYEDFVNEMEQKF